MVHNISWTVTVTQVVKKNHLLCATRRLIIGMTVIWVAAPCEVALMMEAASTSETFVNFYRTTRCNIPEYSHLHTRRSENQKFHHSLSGSVNHPLEHTLSQFSPLNIFTHSISNINFDIAFPFTTWYRQGCFRFSFRKILSCVSRK
jgi:hypothetical protein